MSIESKAYRLIQPGEFEYTTINHEFRDGDVIVNPSKASVCHADLRYYTGNRRKEALDKNYLWLYSMKVSVLLKILNILIIKRR